MDQILPFFLALLLSATQAQARSYSYKEVCVDPSTGNLFQMCDKLRYDEAVGEVPSFNPNTVGFVQEHADDILAAARRYSLSSTYKVSPIAIAGVILAENTLNTHPAGYQDYAEQLHKNICKGMSQSAAETDAGNYAYQQALLEGQFKKHVSMGIGAVKCSTAQTVEKLVEEREHIPPRTHNQICIALNKPSTALPYIAALLAKGIAAYRGVGKNISQEPEIQATIYNIGDPDRLAEKNRNRDPLPNYFGFYIYKKKSAIQHLLDNPIHLAETRANCQNVLDQEKRIGRADLVQRDINCKLNDFLNAFIHPDRAPICHDPGAVPESETRDIEVECKASGHNWEWKRCSDPHHFLFVIKGPDKCTDDDYKVTTYGNLYITPACSGWFKVRVEKRY